MIIKQITNTLKVESNSWSSFLSYIKNIVVYINSLYQNEFHNFDRGYFLVNYNLIININ